MKRLLFILLFNVNYNTAADIAVTLKMDEWSEKLNNVLIQTIEKLHIAIEKKNKLLNFKGNLLTIIKQNIGKNINENEMQGLVDAFIKSFIEKNIDDLENLLSGEVQSSEDIELLINENKS